jgi:hypothetical protein
MAAIWEADLHVQPSNAWSVPLGVIQEKGRQRARYPCVLLSNTIGF